MMDLYEEHVGITQEVRDRVSDKKVLFPADYGKIYTAVAKERNVELHTDQLLSHEMLDEKMVRHVIMLHNSAAEALEAMRTQNEEKLKSVMKETERLRVEILELQKIVYEDPLTKVFNRKWFNDTYISQKDESTFAKRGILAIIDLNDFKHINDEFGHLVGDKVLIHVALKLSESGANVVRLGGDEFLVVYDDCKSIPRIKEKIESVVDYFHKKSFKLENSSFKISFAYGIALFSIGSILENVIDIADKAMYKNKDKKHVNNA